MAAVGRGRRLVLIEFVGHCCYGEVRVGGEEEGGRGLGMCHIIKGKGHGVKVFKG